MEKIKTVLLLATGLLTLSASKASNVKIYFSSLLGPYEAFEKDVTLSLTYEAKSDIYEECLYLYDLEESITYYYTNQFDHTFFSKGNMIITSVDLPLSKFLSSQGLKIYFLVRTISNKKTYFSKTKIIYPRSHSQIISTKYGTEDYIENPVVIDFSNDDEEKETYSFKNTPSSLNNDSSSRLVIQDMIFNYDYFSSFTYGEAYITTSDPQDLFSGLIDKDCNLIKIPLKIVQNGDAIYFAIKEEMYVNPETLEMSLYYKNHYQKTTNFYLPLNKSEELKDYPFSILISNAGDNQIEITIPFTYVQTVYYFDNCITSDYCVQGGIRE